MRLPRSMERLFPGYVFESLDDEAHRDIVIKEVLTYGTWDEVGWLFRRYGEAGVRRAFLADYEGPRTLPRSVVALWELLFVDAETAARRRAEEEADPLARWRCRRVPKSTT